MKVIFVRCVKDRNHIFTWRREASDIILEKEMDVIPRKGDMIKVNGENGYIERLLFDIDNNCIFGYCSI